eukprot:55035_1
MSSLAPEPVSHASNQYSFPNVAYKGIRGSLSISKERFAYQGQKSFAFPLGNITGFLRPKEDTQGFLLRLVAVIRPPKERKFIFDFPSLEQRERCHALLSQLSSPTQPQTRPRPQPKPILPRQPELVSHPAISSSSTTQILSKDEQNAMEVARRRTEMLVNDRKLAQSYENLVKSGIISDREFWESRQLENRHEQKQSTQEGVSGASLNNDDLTEAPKTIEIQLDPAAIHTIFLNHPAVERAYRENVGTVMNEKEFWTRYFRSKAFHDSKQRARKRVARAAAKSTQDQATGASVDSGTATVADDDVMMTDDDELHLGKIEQQIDKEKSASPSTLLKTSISRDADLTSSDKFESNATNDLHEELEVDETTKRRRDLIHRMNRHSQLLVSQWSKEAERAKALLKDDLQEQPFADLDDVPDPEFRELRIEDHSSFFQPSTSSTQPIDLSGMSRGQAEFHVHAECEHWLNVFRMYQPDPLKLSRLAPAGQCALITETITKRAWAREQVISQTESDHVFGSGQQGMKIPETFRQQLLDGYITPVNELLRHFWACFPVTPEIREKPARVCAKLRQYYKGLEQYRAQLRQANRSHFINVINPVMACMEAAFERFESWQRQQAQVR